MKTGEVRGELGSFSRLVRREGPREPTRDGPREDDCECGSDGEVDPVAEPNAGEGARVAEGVLGTTLLSGEERGPGNPLPLPVGKLNASPTLCDNAPVGRKSNALLTASGTFCNLIDSTGGGAAGNGDGTGDENWAERDDRGARDVVGELGANRGGETRLIEVRREMELAGAEEEGEGGVELIGEPGIGRGVALELLPTPTLVPVSSPSPPSPPPSLCLDLRRPKALTAASSPDPLAGPGSPLARGTDLTREARAVRFTSTSGLLSRPLGERR